jgi:hypothetical protein
MGRSRGTLARNGEKQPGLARPGRHRASALLHYPRGAAIRDADPAGDGAKLLRDQVLTDGTCTVRESTESLWLERLEAGGSRR